MFDLKDKVCLVTGAAGGIGLGFVKGFLQRGAKCLMVDVNYREGERLEKELGDQYGSGKVAFKRVDITSHTNFEAAFEKCLDHFDGLDVVVNVAGVDGEINWESQLQINFYGTIRGCKLALKYMGKGGYGCRMSTNRGGVVLNISSIQGLLPWPAMPTYSAAKSGMITYTRCAGHQLEYQQHGVRMICLCPGAVDTAMQAYHPYIGMTEVGEKYLESIDGDLGMALTPDEVGEAGVKLVGTAPTASIWHIHQHGEEAYEIPNEASFANLLKHQRK